MGYYKLFLPLRKETTMYIYMNDKKTEQLVKRPEMAELLYYFNKLENPVILRELRQAFPKQKHLDKNLDFLIDHKIITRQDRRYYLRLSVIDEYPTTEIVEHFLTEMTGYSNEQLLVWLSEKFWSENLTETLAIDFPTATCTRLEHKNFDLVTINHSGTLTETLPNYFNKIEQPELFPKLAELLGDVNREFFNNQIGLLIERIAAGKAPRRESIFLTSLVASQVLEAEPAWQFVIPCFEEESVLDHSLSMDDQTRFLFERQLADRLLESKASYTYLIKKKE